jgi:hypothetical protein
MIDLLVDNDEERTRRRAPASTRARFDELEERGNGTAVAVAVDPNAAIRGQQERPNRIETVDRILFEPPVVRDVPDLREVLGDI